MADDNADVKESSTLLVARTCDEVFTDYHGYRDHLRLDFWFSCAYCSIAEVEARGLGFEIDHYRPQDRFPEFKSAYANLYWSCELCNIKKGDLPPDDAYDRGLRFIRVDHEDPAQHLRLEDDYSIQPLTNVGKFTTVVLCLNDNRHKRLRRARAAIYEASEEILVGLRALKRLSIDDVKKSVRSHFVRVRQELGDRAEEAEALIEEITRMHEWNRSPFIDINWEEKKQSTNVRRTYLSSINVLAPKAPTSHDKPAKQAQTRKKAKKQTKP